MGRIRKFNESTTYKVIDYEKVLDNPVNKSKCDEVTKDIKLSFQEFEDSEVLKEVDVILPIRPHDEYVCYRFLFTLPHIKEQEEISHFADLVKDIYLRLSGLPFKSNIIDFFPFTNQDEHQIVLKIKVNL